MGRDSDILVGLDLGTTKITVAVAEVSEDDPGEAQIIGIGQAVSHGLRKGKIVDLEQAIKSVSDAITDAESTLGGIKIDKVVVAYSCPEAGCHHVRGEISLGKTPRQIVSDDLTNVIKAALGTVKKPSTAAILHALPIKYRVDDMPGIENPLDMTGTKLQVELTALTVPISLTQNVVNCVQRAGVKVGGLVLKPMAEALGALSPDEREIGAVLVSIGGGTTSFSVYSEGRLVHAGEMEVGGDHISNDIACVMKIPFSYAENLKKELNVAPENKSEGMTTLDIRGEKHEIDKARAVEVAESRLAEMFEDTIAPGLEALEKAGMSLEVVLSGGVMLTPGLKELAESYLHTEVRISAPTLGGEMPEGRNDCRYCAAAGLITYLTERNRNHFAYFTSPMSIFKGYEIIDRGPRHPRPPGSLVTILNRTVKNLVKELF
ncbi:MAG: cell division protein FtsA [Pyramidobacter sp.]|nr:cell division protein FtsA [Pyramidobacter sp.]